MEKPGHILADDDLRHERDSTMSLFSAMRSGVSGMSAQSTRIATISDNIANTSTVGYKRAAVDFATLVTSPGADRTSYAAGGVQSNVRYDVGKEGTIQATTTVTDLAIDGDGFFVVASATGGADMSYGLTRAGAFRPDDNGYLRNTSGAYLQGYALEADGSGAPTGASSNFAGLEAVRLGALTYGASRTTGATFSGNIPAQATSGPFTTTSTVYDGGGQAHELSIAWTPTGTADEWSYTVTLTPAAGYTASAPVTGTVTFNATGTDAGLPTAPIADIPVTITGPTGTPETITMSFENVTQLVGDYVPRLDADGAGAAQVSGYDIDDSGKLYAVFDNGARRALYQIPVAGVRNPGGLISEDGNLYSLGADVGQLTITASGSGGLGQISDSSLEASTVDTAEELVSLIETQRAYSSNATIVRTADEMVEETTRLKR